jgi:hypothetical protein
METVLCWYDFSEKKTVFNNEPLLDPKYDCQA